MSLLNRQRTRTMEVADHTNTEKSELSKAARLVMLGDRIVACNGHALTLFDAGRDDVLGRSLLDFSAPTQPDGTPSASALAEKLEGVDADFGEPFHWTCQLSSGSTFPVLTVVGSTTIRGQNFTQLLLFSDKIGGRAAGKADGPASALERSKDAILITNISGVITYVNPAFEEIYGYDAAEILGQDPGILNAGLQPKEIYDELWKTIQTKEAVSAEIINKTKTGQLIQVDATNNPILNAEGEIVGILSLHRDITVRKLNEERLRAAYSDLERRVARQVILLGESNVLRRELSEELERARQRLKRRDLQIRHSFQVAKAFAAASDLVDLYEIAVARFREFFGYYHVRLFHMDAQQGDLELVAATETVEQQPVEEGYRVLLGEGVVGEAAESGAVILVADSASDPSWQLDSTLPDTKCELAVPLFIGDDLFGVIDLHSEALGSFGEEEIRFLESLGGLLARAILNLQVRTELSERLLELSRLQLMFSREGSLEHRSYKGVPPEGYRLPGSADRFTSPPLEGDAIDSRSGVLAGRSRDSEKGVIAAPMSVRGEIIGALEIMADPAQPLSDEDRELLESITVPVAEALESARLLEQTRKHALEMGVVAQVSAAASTILDAEKMLQTVVTLTRERFDLNHVAVFVLEDDTLFQVALATDAGETGMEEAPVELELADATSFISRAAQKGEPVNLPDVGTEYQEPSGLWPAEIRSVLAIPLLVGDETLGVIDLRSNTVDRFTEDEVRIHTTLAAQVAVALKNAYLYANQLETAEKLREVDRLKTEFLASMSHELRTPLNSIIGFADVLLEGIDGPLTVRTREDVSLIRDSGQHLRTLIGDMLDLSKIEAGMMELRYEEVDLAGVAREMIANTKSLAHGKNLVVEYRLDPNLESIEVDRTRFKQILLNLMGNAVKFTEEGSVTLSIQDQNENLLVGVSDTGIGIKVEDMPLVFEQFRQIDGDLTVQRGGTGLGLPISRRLVELHRGEMWVESEPGEGSTFWFTIPKKKPRPRKKRTGTSPFTRPFDE
ncbi:MAG: GAF domain-containing protein [Candidatus Promineifilaceae bacterium]